MTVAFFECRLFLKGTFEEPIDLIGRLDQLKDVRTWVVQGTGDEVCPEKYAEQLVEGLKSNGI
jgi:predicted esterase